MSHIFLLAACAVFSGFSTSTYAQILEPAWEWSAPAGIEWVVPVGGDRPAAVLAATRDGKLHQFHIITGTPRFTEPIAIGKGTRFVSATADAAFVCNETEIVGVSIESGPHTERAAAKELWRTKVVGAELPAPDGDPEFRARLLSAIGTPAGVLAARSDGRIAELRKTDGDASWSVSVPAASEVQLFCDDSIALALHRGKKGIDATFIDRKAPVASPKTVDFADSWPMLAEWTRDGLIAAWPNRVVLLKRDGEFRRVSLRVKWPIKAERLSVLQAAGENSRPLLAILDAAGQLALFDVTSGETVWEKSDNAFRGGKIENAGPHIIVLGEQGIATAFHRDSPEPVARCSGQSGDAVRNATTPFGEWRGAAINPGFLFAAFANPNKANPAAGANIDLLRTPTFRAGEWSAERAKAGERTFSLGSARGVRAIVWSPGRALITRERSLQTFVLPTD